jgi:Fe-S cluster assembly iron-binding protein IscA
MIEIDNATRSKIKEILEKNPGKYFRILVEGDGCAGPYYGLSLEEPNSYEKPANIQGLDFLISDTVKRLAEISTIRIFINPPEKD